MKLIMMEDETEGKGLERQYKVNMVGVNERSHEKGGSMKGIVDYLQKSILPEDKTRARKIRLKATRYAIIRGVLYRKSFASPLQRYLTEKEAAEVLDAIHSEVCENHSRGRSLAHKAITAGYFWPYMMKHAVKFVRRCGKCQKHAPLIHQHSEPCHLVVSPWPFARWGLDIVRKLPLAKAGKCFVLLATDYFTNWVEAESYSNITTNDVISFIWKFIICRFGLPNSLTMDNRTQFNNLKVEGFCEMYGIRVNYSPVYHPQANGMAEATNKAIVANTSDSPLKKRVTNPPTKPAEPAKDSRKRGQSLLTMKSATSKVLGQKSLELLKSGHPPSSQTDPKDTLGFPPRTTFAEEAEALQIPTSP